MEVMVAILAKQTHAVSTNYWQFGVSTNNTIEFRLFSSMKALCFGRKKCHDL